jgi:hypothetical protein
MYTYSGVSMSILIHFFLFVFLGCNNPITGSDKPNIPKSTSQSTQYSTSKGNAVTTVQIGDGTSFKIKKGISLPTSSANGSLLKRYDELGTNPEMVIALWLEACIRAQMGQEEGWKALGEMTLWTGERLKDLNGWKNHHSTHYFVKAIKTKNPSFRSFVVDADPDNGYDVDLDDIKIDVVRYGGKEAHGYKFFITSSGSAMPRPISLKVSTKTGHFIVNEYSSMYVDVQPINDPDKEKFE